MLFCTIGSLAFAAFVQDLPLQYMFTYTVLGVETRLLANRRPSPVLASFNLPSGDPDNNNVYLAVYVSDNLGSTVKCTFGDDGATPVFVQSTPLVITSNVAGVYQRVFRLCSYAL